VTREGIAFVAWSPIAGRAREIAGLLGGEAYVLPPSQGSGPGATLLRYARRVARTSWYLARRRPRTLIVSTPPVLAGVLAVAYGRVTGARVVLDAHPGSFGAQGDDVSAKLQPLHRWAVRRADATLVTTDAWADRVRAWGGRALIVHEAPPGRGPFGPPSGSGRVLFVCTFEPDEPVEEVFAAAATLPDVRFVVTGDLRKRPGIEASAPPNVALVGFLDADAYWREMEQADLVLALTTEATSVQRAGYETVYAQRVLVVSDWPVAREVFPHAIHVPNHAVGIAAGVRRGLAHLADHSASTQDARLLQERRWSRQLSGLRAVAAAGPWVPAMTADGTSSAPVTKVEVS
jgi:Glycosyl transferase 4-like domain